MYLSGFIVRWKYYFIWFILEVVVIIFGFGFSGWVILDDDKKVKLLWIWVKNVDIMKVEFVKSGVELLMCWNVFVSIWF